MVFVKKYEAGDTARFKTVFRDDDGEAIRPDGNTDDKDVKISIENLSTGEVVVDNEDMTELSDTEFRYDWQTSEDMRGEFSVEVVGSFGGQDALNRDRVELVEHYAPDEGQ